MSYTIKPKRGHHEIYHDRELVGRIWPANDGGFRVELYEGGYQSVSATLASASLGFGYAVDRLTIAA